MDEERLLLRARTVWRGAIERDELLAGPVREVRLRQSSERRQQAAAGAATPLFVLALAVIVLVAWRQQDGVAAREIPDDDAVVTDGPGEPRPGRDPETDAPLVVARPCPGCVRGAGRAVPLVAGDVLAPGERVQVPRGSTLVLCWSLDSAASASREIAGPAEVRAGEQAASASGTPVEAVPTASPPRVAEDPRGQWDAAQAAIRAGDRRTAERSLRALLAMTSAPASLHDRASFTLAELEMARGSVDEARALLDRVAGSRDAALAADAVFLQARATASPGDRAALLARYVARRPPSPYREQALLDEALARADAGDTAGARALADALRAMPHLPDMLSPSLVRLERRLGR
jgi:hypothetical protein